MLGCRQSCDRSVLDALLLGKVASVAIGAAMLTIRAAICVSVGTAAVLAGLSLAASIGAAARATTRAIGRELVGVNMKITDSVRYILRLQREPKG